MADRETVEKLAQNDEATVRAVEKVGEARPTSRPASPPIMLTMRERDLERLRSGDVDVVNAVTRLRDVRPVRRSERLRGAQRNYRE